MTELAEIRNGESVPLEDVPRLSLDDFRAALGAAPSHRRRAAALFGHPVGDGIELVAALAEDEDATIVLARALVKGDAYPAITPVCPEVHLFEREIAEQWGIKPEGHPWLKPVRFTLSARPGKDAWSRTAKPTVGVMEFYRVEGEEIHEVAVGPVHAGVIEPGHFRFQCHGEHVFHLEISLGYQHRGVERALIGGPNKRTIHYMETLAGDTTAAHTTAHCELVEGLAGAKTSGRAQAIRGVALELERLANHTGNLGALAGDVGFLPTAAFCGRLRGDFLNLTAQVCGSRFGRGLVRPGGVAFDIDEARAKEMRERLAAAVADVDNAVDLLMNTNSVRARLDDTGRVARETALELGLVGVAARASGVARDVRHDFPAGIYRFAHIAVSGGETGDVFARGQVRWEEIQRSAVFLRQQLTRLPRGPLRVNVGPLAPNRIGVSLAEGTRGEVCHVAITGDDGKFLAYKVVDASFHNWSGLAMALRDQQISDFPLCNKSFDLSYCGFDL
jgi:Ni,Fe-hydrogenase III large subunit